MAVCVERVVSGWLTRSRISAIPDTLASIAELVTLEEMMEIDGIVVMEGRKEVDELKVEDLSIDSR